MTETVMPKLPATPAGDRLAQFLDIQASGSPERMRQFIVEHYAPQANLADRLGAYLHEYQLRYFVSRGYAIGEIVDAGPHHLAVRAAERLTEHEREIRLETEPDSPHRIVSVRVSPTSHGSTARPHTPAQVGAACDQFLRRLSAADAFSGAVLIAHHGVPVLTAAYGFADRRHGAPNRADTAFAVASVGKMFTGVAVAQLVERGLLALDGPVGRYLPDYPEPVAGRVTIHHLLTHTSGLDCFWGPAFTAGISKIRSIGDYLPFIRDQAPAFAPGSQFQYSNAGYILLGAIIERVTGGSYYDHVAEAIFQPAGMLRTGFYERDEVVPNVAMGYTRLDEDYTFSLVPARENLYDTPAKGSSGGGGYATVGDLQRFCDALLAHRLLSPAMTGLVTTGKVAMADTGGEQYGYGFIDARVRGRRVLGHSGGNPGTSAFVEIYPESGYTAVILCNYDFAFSVREQIRNLVLTQRPAARETFYGHGLHRVHGF